ncbi:MAG: stalk domain-containing protein, partial [Bacillota bacterium]|nr:stalk domain-containing protein [Bacillota bacterium]
KNDKEVKFKDNGDGTFTFTMPSGGVEVEPFFEKIKADEPVPEQKDMTMVLYIDQLTYLLNNTPVMNDMAPMIRSERTALPIRTVAENLGASVAWKEADRKVTITKADTVIEIFIGEPIAIVNGDPVELDMAAFIENDRTYMPLRFVAEHLGANVIWDGNAKTVTITLK